ncbi:hypothetical protein SUGI_1182190 [Cryptomeria japonica]|nr:hypothetical protein SUGI_1182190 [Cryptomeria japonica]
MEGTERGILCRFAAFVFRFVVLIYLMWPLMLFFVARKALRYIWSSFGSCHGIRTGYTSRFQLRQTKQMRVHRYLEDQFRLVEDLITGQNRVPPCEMDKDEQCDLAGDEAYSSDLDYLINNVPFST